MRSNRPKWIWAAVAAGLLIAACNAHAPPGTGRFRPPGSGPMYPDYPEIDCDRNTTIDCRPPIDGP